MNLQILFPAILIIACVIYLRRGDNTENRRFARFGYMALGATLLILTVATLIRRW
jgi:hypothetical protein